MSEKVINKIRNLFKHAESARAIGSLAEAETAAALAHRLLLEHKLDMATIERATLDVEDPLETRHVEGKDWGDRDRRARTKWTENLANVVAKAHFCRVACNSSSNALTFFGRKSDTEVAIFVFTWLARTSARMGREAIRTIKTSQYRKVQPRQTRRGVNQKKSQVSTSHHQQLLAG